MVKPTNPGTPTWSHDGIICTGETYKSVVKLTFAKGTSLKDAAKLFNSSLEGTQGAQSTSMRGRFKTLIRRGRPQYIRRKGKAKTSELGAQNCRSVPDLDAPNARMSAPQSNASLRPLRSSD